METSTTAPSYVLPLKLITKFFIVLRSMTAGEPLEKIGEVVVYEPHGWATFHWTKGTIHSSSHHKNLEELIAVRAQGGNTKMVETVSSKQTMAGVGLNHIDVFDGPAGWDIRSMDGRMKSEEEDPVARLVVFSTGWVDVHIEEDIPHLQSFFCLDDAVRQLGVKRMVKM